MFVCELLARWKMLAPAVLLALLSAIVAGAEQPFSLFPYPSVLSKMTPAGSLSTVITAEQAGASKDQNARPILVYRIYVMIEGSSSNVASIRHRRTKVVPAWSLVPDGKLVRLESSRPWQHPWHSFSFTTL